MQLKVFSFESLLALIFAFSESQNTIDYLETSVHQHKTEKFMQKPQEKRLSDPRFFHWFEEFVQYLLSFLDAFEEVQVILWRSKRVEIFKSKSLLDISEATRGGLSHIQT